MVKKDFRKGNLSRLRGPWVAARGEMRKNMKSKNRFRGGKKQSRSSNRTSEGQKGSWAESLRERTVEKAAPERRVLPVSREERRIGKEKNLTSKEERALRRRTSQIGRKASSYEEKGSGETHGWQKGKKRSIIKGKASVRGASAF